MAIRTYEFLGLKYILPVTHEFVDGDISERTISGSKSVQSSGIRQIILTVSFIDDWRGSNRAAALLGAHRSKHGLDGIFPVQLPQLSHLDIPTTPVRTHASGTYKAGQTSIRVTMSSSTTLLDGTFFTIPGDKRVYQVDGTITGAGFITIIPELQKDLTAGSTVELDFAPVMQAQYRGPNQLPLGPDGKLRLQRTFEEVI